MSAHHFNWKQWKEDAQGMSKDELIRILNKMTARSKKDHEKRVYIEENEYKVIETYNSYLATVLQNYENEEETSAGKKKRKYFEEIIGKRKQIEVLEEEKKNVMKKIEQVRKPKLECYGKKKEAQNKINKKLINQTFKYFEKHSDEILVKLFEVFIGCLRNVSHGRREDVEIYLKNHKGLLVSMNKMEERKINREYAKNYADTLKEIKEPLENEKFYSKYIPIYVWMDNVIRIIKFDIEEKHLEEDLRQKEDSIFKLNHDIDRNQIILDHLGVGPSEYNHFNNLVIFWKRHLVDLDKIHDADKDKLENWETYQARYKSDKKHNVTSEEVKEANMKMEYPVMGIDDELKEKDRGKSTKKAAGFSVEESKGSGSYDDEDNDEEDDDDGDEEENEGDEEEADDDSNEESNEDESGPPETSEDA